MRWRPSLAALLGKQRKKKLRKKDLPSSPFSSLANSRKKGERRTNFPLPSHLSEEEEEESKVEENKICLWTILKNSTTVLRYILYSSTGCPNKNGRPTLSLQTAMSNYS